MSLEVRVPATSIFLTIISIASILYWQTLIKEINVAIFNSRSSS